MGVLGFREEACLVWFKGPFCLKPDGLATSWPGQWEEGWDAWDDGGWGGGSGCRRCFWW